MSLETIISAARQRVLNRVSAILADGRTHALAVRRELIVETAGKMGDLENCIAATIKAAMVAQEERSSAERPYYAMTEEVLTEALKEIGRRSKVLILKREAYSAGLRDGRLPHSVANPYTHSVYLPDYSAGYIAATVAASKGEVA